MNSGVRTISEVWKLKSHVAGLEELLKTFEQASLEQARSLEFKNIILETQQEASIDGILIVDENGVVISHNRRFAEMWGFPPESLLHRNHAEAMRPILGKLGDPEGFVARLGHLYERREESGRDMIPLADGRLFDRYTSPMMGPDGTYYGRVWYLRDVTEQAMADKSLRKLSVAVEESSDWVLVTGRDGRIEYANRAVETMSGYRKEDLLGRTPGIFRSGRHDESFYKEMWETILSGRTFRGIISNRRKDGELFEVFHTITPLKDGKGEITNFISMAKDVTQQKILEERIHRLAYYDDLTGLPNRVLHAQMMARTIEIARRHKQKFALLYMDLDNFKRINETFGHTAGDMLLKSVSQKLSSLLRSSDYVARCGEENVDEILCRPGGDEFLVLLHNVCEAQDAARVARRILAELSAPWDVSGREVFITASIGISLYPADGETVDNLLKNADAAMYHAKAEGRNNYQFYSQSLNASVLELLTLESEIRKGMERGEFTLYYQPRLDATTRSITGMEALIRWNHPEKGLLFPGKFISAAENSGLIVPMAEFSLRAACAQLKTWLDEGLKPITVAVNVSGRQFDQRNLVEVVDGVLRDTGLPPRHLELEITESTIMRNPEDAVRTLLSMKERGIGIAVDDFGTGYSSLNYLKRLPLDYLKIDQSFVANLPSSRSDGAIVRATIAMAHSLNLKVIAEGVETEEQMAFLCEHGCDEIQGFLFSRAVPPEEFPELLVKESL